MNSSRVAWFSLLRSASSFSLDSGRASTAALLCGLMAAQPVYGGTALAEAPHESKNVGTASVGEQGQERVLHALNRLTFGPRPGDVAAVQAMGLQKWFELQLKPGKIDDSRLEARLADYPAMGMSIAELSARYPGPGAIKQMALGKVALPDDPTARAVATDEIAFYKIQKAKQAAGAAQTGDAGTGAAMNAAGGSAAMDGTMGASAPSGQAQGGKKSGPKVAAGLNALDEANDMAEDRKPLPAGAVAPDPMMMADGGGAGRGRFAHDQAMLIVNQPPTQRMRTLLAMPAPELTRFRQSLKGEEVAQLTEGLTPVQKETLAALPGSLRMIAAETMETRILRDVYSERQLEAVMTDFWLNHFNVYLRKSQLEPYLIPSYERDAIRPYALGNFEDLLVATAKSPAMLVYLDNWRSIGADSLAANRLKKLKEMRPDAPIAKAASAGLNENYGRELMELHTLGVNGGYSQADVTQVAKVFTGWTVDKPYGIGKDGGGTFQFEEKRHEPGSKVVLGKTISENGEKEGLEVLHMLATSPATAHFISQKLAIRFVSDRPDPALVDRMAASFLSSHGDIKTVLRTMFDAPEFWAPAVERAKVKTPEEFVISAVRASGAEVKNPLALAQSLDKLGMPLYGMQTPNGYSWAQDGWVSTGALVSRMNFALVMTGDRLPGTRPDWSRLLGENPAGGLKNAGYAVPGTADGAGTDAVEMAKERRLEMILLGGPVSERTRHTVLSQAGDTTVADQAATEFDLRATGGKRPGKGVSKGNGAADAGAALPDDAQAAVMAGLLLGSPEFQRR